jgi:hypothetical protein
MRMMKTRIAPTSTALALFGAAALGALSTAAEAQAVSGNVYYGPQPVYVAPQPVYVYPPAPAYYYPAPAYYYPPPAPAYYYPAPAPAYYPQPYWAPAVSANLVFDFGGGGHGHYGHRH